MSERTRFAPAPTGPLHVGGARTALFSWLVARAHGGRFILRLEDTDRARVIPGTDAVLIEDLRWLGLDWDEGPDVGGPHGPYRQSERAREYEGVFRRLGETGCVYPCYCTRDELEAAREVDRAQGRPPRYAGTCRDLSAADRARFEAEGRRPAWRFAVRPGERVHFEDAVHGPMGFSTDDIGDFVVMRSDGGPTYDMACVADDTAMDITFVVRGDDHLANTARQILLLDALGAPRPRYAHLPLVTAPGGEPLSKSKGGAAIGGLRAEGYLPSAVVEYIASLGWKIPDGLDVHNPYDLVRAFRIEAVSASPSVHDPERLCAIGAKHLRRLDGAAFLEFVVPFLPPLPDDVDREALLVAVRDEAKTGADVARLVERIIVRPTTGPVLDDPILESALSALGPSTVSWDPVDVVTRLKGELKRHGVPVRHGLHALRTALIGTPDGPPMASLFRVLGRSEAETRIRRAALTHPGTSGDIDVSQEPSGLTEA